MLQPESGVLDPSHVRALRVSKEGARVTRCAAYNGALRFLLEKEVTLRIGGFATLIQVFDMPTSLAFYRDVMGFNVISDAPEDGRCDWVWLKCGESELMLNTAYEAEDRPPAADPARVAAHCDTALYFDCKDVDAAYADLRARGVPVKDPIVTDYGMKQVYLKDPDGYEICLQQPVDAAHAVSA